MLSAINGMMLDMLAAVARKDYEDHRHRQLEGIDKAKRAVKDEGRQLILAFRRNIAAMLKDKCTISEIVNLLNVPPKRLLL